VLSLPLTEGESLELKRDWSGPQNALKALAAFANTRGGVLVLGVEDDGVTVGGFAPDDNMERRIIGEVVSQLNIRPELQRVPTSDGPTVLTLTVQPSPTLVTYGGRYFMRVGASNQDMTPADVARRTLQNSGRSWDGLPGSDHFRPDDTAPAIDPAAFQKFLRLSAARLPQARFSDPQRRTLENLDLVADGQPSRAALLLFGRRPQDTSTGIGVQIAQFKEGRLLQDKTINGPLVEQLSDVLDTLRLYLGVGYDIEDQATPEPERGLSVLERLQRIDRWPYPLAALREAVLNALIHRDYTSGDRVQIRVDTNQLSFWNPGGLVAGISLESLTQPGHPSRKRNPHIAEAFYHMGLVERWGTGTTRMIEAMQQAQLPAPTFGEDGSGFRLVFRSDLFPPERLAGLNDRQQLAVTYLRNHPTITNAQYRKITGAPPRTATLDLQKLVSLGFLVLEGKGRAASYRLNQPGNAQ